MMTPDQIEGLTQTIVEVEQPQQILLFGSYAYGEPREESDLDVLLQRSVQVCPGYNASMIYKGGRIYDTASYFRTESRPFPVVSVKVTHRKKLCEIFVKPLNCILNRLRMIWNSIRMRNC
jgi:hypothetical protein